MDAGVTTIEDEDQKEKMSQDIKEYNILLLSYTGAGKTCIINRFVRGVFHRTIATLGVNSIVKDVKLSHGKTVRMKIVDNSGNEKYRSIVKIYYKRADGIILIYDITSKENLGVMDYYLNDLRESIISNAIPIFLVGNKIDEICLRKITFEEGEKFAKEKGLMFCECSAKTGENIDFIFNKLANEINPEEEERKKRKREVQKELLKIEKEHKKICAIF